MLYIDEDQNIELTRGDTGLFTISLVDQNGAEYIPQVGDSVRFAMSKSYGKDVILNKSIPIDTLTLELEPTDTKSLDFGKYVYDIEVTDSQGRVSTVIMGNLTLTKEVH